MDNENTSKPGSQLRDAVFQQNDPFFELRQQDALRANHEQGGKVQFIFQAQGGPIFAYNQSWPIIGYKDGGYIFASIAAMFVKIPDDVVVNSVSLKLFLAASEFDDPIFTMLHQWRYAKDIKMYIDPNYGTNLYLPPASEALQRYTGSPVDVTNDVFGSSTLNVGVTNPQDISGGLPTDPGVQTFSPTSGGLDFLATQITGGTEKMVVFQGVDTTPDYVSPFFAQLIVNGYTRNR